MEACCARKRDVQGAAVSPVERGLLHRPAPLLPVDGRSDNLQIILITGCIMKGKIASSLFPVYGHPLVNLQSVVICGCTTKVGTLEGPPNLQVLVIMHEGAPLLFQPA